MGFGTDMEIKRILVPVDFSDNSLQAKSFAEGLAEQFKSEMELLHVVESSPYEVYIQKGFQADVPIYVPIGETPPGSKPNVLVKNLMDEARNRLEQMAGPKAKVKTAVRHGRAVEEILREVDAYKPDLLVICTHGWTGLKHMLLGSVTEKIVRLCPVPVLTTRGNMGS